MVPCVTVGQSQRVHQMEAGARMTSSPSSSSTRADGPREVPTRPDAMLHVQDGRLAKAGGPRSQFSPEGLHDGGEVAIDPLHRFHERLFDFQYATR